jgi:hypothetical protein
MSIFSLGGNAVNVPEKAILEEMYQDRYFLPGTIHGGDYLIRVYLNDAHCESEPACDHYQFEIDYITKELITEARTIDPSLEEEFYEHLFNAENFCARNDGSGDFVSLIEEWPASEYLTHSELVKWAEGKYSSPKGRKGKPVYYVSRNDEESFNREGILCEGGTILDLSSGEEVKKGDYWITNISPKTTPHLTRFVEDYCKARCKVGSNDCDMPVWECPKFREYLNRREYTIEYEEVLSHTFYVDACSKEDAEAEFERLADESYFDFTDGYTSTSGITRIVEPSGKENIICNSHSDLEYMAEHPDKIAIPLGDGFSLVAEKNMDPDYKEIFLYLRNDKDGIAFQDLAIIGEQYTYEDESVKPLHGRYSVKVYADPDNEDWTDEHLFGRANYEEA